MLAAYASLNASLELGVEELFVALLVAEQPKNLSSMRLPLELVLIFKQQLISPEKWFVSGE